MASTLLVFVYLSVSACVLTSCRSLHIPSFRNKYVIPSHPRSFDSPLYYPVRNSFSDAVSHYYGPPPMFNFDSEDSEEQFGHGRTGSRRWVRAFQNPRSVPETSHFLIVVPPLPGDQCPEGTLPDHSGQCRVTLNVFNPPFTTTPPKRIHEPSGVPELIPEVVPEMATENPSTTSTTTTTSTTSTTPSPTFRAKSCNSTAGSTTTTERSPLPGGAPQVSPAPKDDPSAPTGPSGQEQDLSVQNSECVESAVEVGGDGKVDGEGKEDAVGDEDEDGEEDEGLAGAPLPVLLLLRDMPQLLRLPSMEKLSGKQDRDLKKVLEKVEGGEASLINNVIEE